MRLKSLGLVDLRRNCGAVFLPFGEKELGDLYAVRSLLEVEAARCAATRLDETVIDRLNARFRCAASQSLPGYGLDTRPRTSWVHRAGLRQHAAGCRNCPLQRPRPNHPRSGCEQPGGYLFKDAHRPPAHLALPETAQAGCRSGRDEAPSDSGRRFGDGHFPSNDARRGLSRKFMKSG